MSETIELTEKERDKLALRARALDDASHDIVRELLETLQKYDESPGLVALGRLIYNVRQLLGDSVVAGALEMANIIERARDKYLKENGACQCSNCIKRREESN